MNGGGICRGVSDVGECFFEGPACDGPACERCVGVGT